MESTLAARLREELREYALVAGYLYVCFGAIFLYRTAIAEEAGLQYLPLGVAAVKALVIGKFVMLGKAAGVGTRGAGPVWWRVARRSVLIWLLLIALSVLEELIAGRVHGRSIAETLTGFEQRSVLELIATSLLMLLILVPLISVSELRRILGPGVLGQILRSGERAREAQDPGAGADPR